MTANSRTGCGKCGDCQFHDMDGYNHYCTKPDRMRDGEKRRWMNETYARGWHDCCVIFEVD